MAVVDVAPKVDYPAMSFRECNSSSGGDTEEFIRSVRDGLKQGKYNTASTDNLLAAEPVVNSEDEQPSLPSDDDVNEIAKKGTAHVLVTQNGLSSTCDIVDLPDSDDENSHWLSPPRQLSATSIKQVSAGVENDLVLTYPNSGMEEGQDMLDEVLAEAEKENNVEKESGNECRKKPRTVSLSSCVPSANMVSERLRHVMKQRSQSCSDIDASEYLDSTTEESVPTTDSGYPVSVPGSKPQSKSLDEAFPISTPALAVKRTSSATECSSSHRISEVSTMSDHSRRRSTLSYNRRFSNFSTATTTYTTCSTVSSFLETDDNLGESLLMEIFDSDDIDGIIPPRFLGSNPEAVVENIREEDIIGSISYSPSMSCDQSSVDEDFNVNTFAFADLAAKPAVRQSSPERQHPIQPAAFPIEGGPPRPSLFNLNSVLLDTVEEETASQISPSPRVMSPYSSMELLDNIESTNADGQQFHKHERAHRLSVPYLRKLSLPQQGLHHHHHRYSVESINSDVGSFYFSVTSYDDELTSKLETVESPQDQSPRVERRQRKVGTVATPPNPEILKWLDEQSNDPDPEAPWPFNEEPKVNTLTVPQSQSRRLSDTSDISYHSCREDYASSACSVLSDLSVLSDISARCDSLENILQTETQDRQNSNKDNTMSDKELTTSIQSMDPLGEPSMATGWQRHKLQHQKSVFDDGLLPIDPH